MQGSQYHSFLENGSEITPPSCPQKPMQNVVRLGINYSAARNYPAQDGQDPPSNVYNNCKRFSLWPWKEMRIDIAGVERFGC